MELLDTYDEQEKYIGTFSRKEVHEKGLWHKTIHCWLYDEFGNVFFQIRTDANKLYTTASGHVLAGESLEEAFKRETKEEIGLDIEFDNIKKIDVVLWQMDKTNPDGSIIKDRAFANIYIGLYSDEFRNFHFDKNEVLGIAKVNAKETLDLFNGKRSSINAIYLNPNDKTKDQEKQINNSDFVCMKHETLIQKYGKVLEEVIKITSKNTK